MGRFDHISFSHLEQAMERMQEEGVPKARVTNKYEAVYDGWAYPHRYLISLAGYFAGEFIRYREVKDNKSIERFLKKFDIQLILKEEPSKLESPEVKDEKIHNRYWQQRIARVCFNTNGWRAPSGAAGKSKNDGLFECQYGFGFEEWLFDDSKEINGYHYAVLQPVYNKWRSYEGEVFNIRLYTLDSRTQQRYWVGLLEGIEVISKEESEQIRKVYKQKGWLKERTKELKEVNANTRDWKEKYYWAFTVKIPMAQVRGRNTDIVPIQEDSLFKGDRYNLRHAGGINQNVSKVPFKFKNGQLPEREFIKRKFVEKETEYENRHWEIQKVLIDQLRKEFGSGNVGYEVTLAQGNRADVMVKRGPDFYDLYEVKSYASLMTSIRVALGQLIEYALSNTGFKVNRLILVSDIQPTEEISTYLEEVNAGLDLDFSYLQIEINSISD